MGRLARFLPAPLLLTLGVMLVACGGPASTVFNQAAPVAPDTLVTYITRSNYASTASVVGLRARDGTQVWRTTVGARDDNAATAVYGGVLYIEATPASTTPAVQPPSSGFVIALRLTDGTVLWRRSLPQLDYNVNLTTDGTTVFAASARGGLYALDPSDGAIRWHVTADVIGPAHPVGTVVVVSVGTYQPPTDPTGIAAYRESDGTLLWQKEYAIPIVANQLAAYITVGDDTFALASQDGHSLWTYQSGATINNGYPHPSQVIGANDQLVLVQVQFPIYSDSAPTRDYLAALDVRTGQVTWKSSPGLKDDSSGGRPLFVTTGDATTIYGVYKSQLVALLGADGTRLWQADLSPYFLQQLSSVDGVVFALLYPPNCNFGPCSVTHTRLAAFAGASGTIYWERDLPDAAMLAGV